MGQWAPHWAGCQQAGTRTVAFPPNDEGDDRHARMHRREHLENDPRPIHRKGGRGRLPCPALACSCRHRASNTSWRRCLGFARRAMGRGEAGAGKGARAAEGPRRSGRAPGIPTAARTRATGAGPAASKGSGAQGGVRAVGQDRRERGGEGRGEESSPTCRLSESRKTSLPRNTGGASALLSAALSSLLMYLASIAASAL